MSFGASDTAGTDFRQLRAPNTSGMSSLLLGLASYWKMDEVGSVARIDERGNSNLLVAGAPCPSIAGKIGAAVQTSGTSSYLQASHNSSQNFAGSMSIAGWINIANLAGGSGIHSILTKCAGVGPDVEFLLVYNNGGGGWQFTVSGDGTTQVSCIVAASPTINTWYHVAAVYDAGASQIRLRINDASVGSAVQPFHRTALCLDHCHVGRPAIPECGFLRRRGGSMNWACGIRH